MNSPKETSKKTFSIPAKILAIQAEIEGIEKLAYNAFQNYHYFTEPQVLKLLKPLLQKHNLTLMISDDTSQPFFHEKDDKYHYVKYLKKMIISDGDTSLEFSFWAAGSNQDLAKAKGAAETYALKYLLSKFFLITIVAKGTDDPDIPKESVIEEATKTTKPPKIAKEDLPADLIATIQNIKPKTDKNGNKYLLLTLDKLENNVFVFSYRVEEEQWKDLQVKQTYHFFFEKSEKEMPTLSKFTKVTK